jgi:GT2 family glycosyltransferase
MRRDLRLLKSILPSWAIAFLRRLRELLRRGRQLRLQTPRARREAALQELEALPQRPLISLVMPTYKTDLKYLREAVDSVLGQYYPEWELIVVDDASGDPELARALSAYDGAHARIKYRQLTENSGISAATNAGMELVEGEFVGFLDHDDTLTPDALLRVAQALAEEPELGAVYSDSDKLTIGGVRADPFLKPSWSPVYALGAMYIGHLLVVRTAVARDAGGFDSAFDKIQDFEFMLRVSERTDRIHHIPQILYHWRAIPGSIAAGTEQKSGVEELQARAVSQHLERLGLPARAEPHPVIPHRAVLTPANGAAPQPRVSIVIRGREGSPELERLRRSLEMSAYPELETIVVAEGSRAEAHNKGAAEASGEYLLFLAPDTEVVDPAWLSQLVLHASLPAVAAVGPKLVRPDGKVEQAGVAIGLRDPAAPMLAGIGAEGDGYYGALPCSREVSGLSAECMLVRREDFEREGGFLELFACEYEDLDLCRRLSSSGRKCVYAATAVLVTHRSEVSRRAGSDIVDRALFVDTWYDQLAAGDPYFNPGFARQRADYVPSGWLEPVHRAVGAMRSR